MSGELHMIKLCVGCDSVDELIAWRKASRKTSDPWILRTRQTPRRAAELEAGGSLFRVYRGIVLSRQRILAVNTVGDKPASRCEITLDETVILTAPTPRRAFQGWRYLLGHEAPRDLTDASGAAEIPPELSRRLLEAGVW